MADEAAEMSTREVRARLADAVNRAIAGEVTYVTQHGRRVAALVPLSAVRDVPADEAIAEPVLRKRRLQLNDFLSACLRAVAATPDSMLKSLKPYWPEDKQR